MNPEKLDMVLLTEKVVYLETNGHPMKWTDHVPVSFEIFVEVVGSFDTLHNEDLSQAVGLKKK